MKTKFCFILSVFLVVCFCPVSSFSQQTEKVTQLKTTPQRAAEGQTKWMMNELKLDRSLYKPLYEINLRYRLKTDSIHLSSLALSSKRAYYSDYNQARYLELKKILTTVQIENYQKIIDSIRADSKLVKQ
jgi:hypothetical protein